jgi:hypothetical protein
MVSLRVTDQDLGPRPVIGELGLGGEGLMGATHEVSLHQVGRRGLVIEGVDGLDEGTIGWLRIFLPDHGEIRPLVQLGKVTKDRSIARIRHMFPDHLARVNAYHEAMASPAGY